MSEELEKNILVIDSSAIIHRSYHGYPERFSSYNQQSINTNILWGYLNYTYKLSLEFEFDECIHVLDPEGGSKYRKEIYPLYKAGRPPSPDDFIVQKKLMPELLNAFHQKWLCVDGVESDDVLASIARVEANKGNKVLVLSPDKDILQIVEDMRIAVGRLCKDKQGRNVHNIYEELGVYQTFGVNAYQIPDFLALVGDVGDNIKGVPGVGEKTAAKLIDAYNDVETIIMKSVQIIEEHEAGIKSKEAMNYKMALKVQSVADTLPLMKRLTTSLTDIIVPDIESLVIHEDKKLNSFYRDFLNVPTHWSDSLGQKHFC